MIWKLIISGLFALLMSSSAFAQQTVFLVRHAERADTTAGTPPSMAADPNLSEAGRQRAESLATVLKDAGIGAIFVTEYRRTQETAAPLAKALGLAPIVITSKDTAALIERVRQSKRNALVVGHSNSVPNVIKGLGVTTPISIADTEFDQLFVVTTHSELIQLRYR